MKFIPRQIARLKGTKSAIVQELPNNRFKVTVGLETIEIGSKDEQAFYGFLSKVNV